MGGQRDVEHRGKIFYEIHTDKLFTGNQTRFPFDFTSYCLASQVETVAYGTQSTVNADDFHHPRSDTIPDAQPAYSYRYRR